MIDLLNPNREELLKKWQHALDITSHIRTWDTPHELAWLAEYATRCENMLEIGSFDGRSAKVMLIANPDLKLTSLDTWDDGNLAAYKHNLGPEIDAGRVTFHQGESQITIDKLQPGYDACFIDGGHLEPLVVSDINNVMPLMKPGSLMAGHDFRSEGNGLNDVGMAVRSVLGEKAKNVCDSIWVYQT